MPSTLVTGGTGFLGANLVRKLVERGEEVRVLVRSQSPGMAQEGLPVEKVLGDITNLPTLRAAVKGCRRVYHVAGLFEIGPFGRKAMEAANVEGTRNVCLACREEGIERLVYTSSTNALGYGSAEAPGTEETPWNFGPFGLPYADTKYCAEQVVRGFLIEGLPAIIVNPAFMLGPWDVKPTSGKIILSALKAPRLLYPDGGHTLLDVEDAAEGHILAMEKAANGESYILANRRMTYCELFTMMNEVLGLKKSVNPLPKRLSQAVGWIGTLAGAPLQKNLAVNHLAVRMGFLHRYVSAEKAVKELGLPQSPIEGAIEKAYRWFRDHGYC